jgi:hypothetical protein
MFTIPRVNVIESDEGYSVEVLGQTGLKFINNNETYFIDSEVLAGPAGMVIYKRGIRKWDEKKKTITDEELLGNIVNKIIAAFKFRDLNIQVI